MNPDAPNKQVKDGRNVAAIEKSQEPPATTEDRLKVDSIFNIGGFVNGWMRDGWREPKPGEPEIIYIDDTQQPAQQPANQPTQGDDSAPAQEQ